MVTVRCFLGAPGLPLTTSERAQTPPTVPQSRCDSSPSMTGLTLALLCTHCPEQTTAPQGALSSGHTLAYCAPVSPANLYSSLNALHRGPDLPPPREPPLTGPAGTRHTRGWRGQDPSPVISQESEAVWGPIVPLTGKVLDCRAGCHSLRLLQLLAHV